MSANASMSGVATSADAERSSALATLAITRDEERNQRENNEKRERCSVSVVASLDIVDVVKLRVGGKLFEADKSTLFRFDHTFFHGLFSSVAWQPEADGAYFIDRPATGFDRILEYLSSGKLSVGGLSESEEECLYCSLDYLLIPYKRQWHYTTQLVIEGLRADFVFELNDGRLCGTYGNDIIVWSMDTNTIDLTLEGHTSYTRQAIQLQDGRVCSCSRDDTIKIWSLDSGLCVLTLTDDITDRVLCIMQLIDGRICSFYQYAIKVWNATTGVCEITWYDDDQNSICYIAQLADGRICGVSYKCTISIFNVLNGNVQLLWDPPHAYVNWDRAIVCIDATRICSDSGDCTIKVWNIATKECERTLEGHTRVVTSIVLMQDGRLCSASHEGTVKLWNLETGECEKTFTHDFDNQIKPNRTTVMQLRDGRLVSCVDGSCYVWS